MIFETSNVQYRGFQSISTFHTMDALADSFEINSNNRWIGSATPVRAGDECRILDGESNALITGYIDQVEPNIEGNITIKGRSKAGDLIDSTIAGNGEFAGLSLIEILSRVCSPFGITVSGESGDVVSRFRYSLSDKAVATIRELVTRQGYLCNSDTGGNLVIRKAGSDRAPIALQEGNNIVKGQGVCSAMAQNSSYRVLGQSDTDNKVSGSFDGQSPRYRPMTTENAGSLRIRDAQTASEWLGRIKDGGATSFNITVADIQNVNPNSLIDTQSPSLGIDGTMLVRSVKRIVDGEGSRTVITIVNPYTFGLDYIANDFLA